MFRYRIIISAIITFLFGILALFISNREQPFNGSPIEERLTRVLQEAESERQKIMEDPKVIVSQSIKHYFFLLDSTGVIAWSKGDLLIDFGNIPPNNHYHLVQSSTGDFLVKKSAVNHQTFLITLIPLVRKYPIVNQYLTNQWNREIFNSMQGSVWGASSTAGKEITFHNRILFRFEPVNRSANQSLWQFIFITLTILFFLFTLYCGFRSLHQKKKFEVVFVLALISLILTRLFMFRLDYPNRWTASALWDAQYFASASYNASIGDLVINSSGILVISLYAFFTYSRWKLIRLIFRQQKVKRFLAALILTAFGFFAFLFPFLFVETIYHNSSISLDVTESIRVDGLRLFSWLSVLAGSITAFLWVHIFLRSSVLLLKKFSAFFPVLLLSALLFTIYFLLAERNYLITLAAGMLFFTFLFQLKLYSFIGKVEFRTFFYFFTFITFLGIQHGLGVKLFMEERRRDSHFRFASSYLIGRDVLGEYLLNEAAVRISSDAFIQSGFTLPFFNRASIRQKVRQVYLNAYFDRYDIQLYFYTVSGEPLDSQSPSGLFSRLSRLQQSPYKTDYDNIYFLKPSDSETNKRYISVVPVHRGESVIGYILVDLRLKRVIPQNVYPELLVDSRFAQYFESRDKSFAFLQDNKVLSSFGNFNYERNFEFEILNDHRIYETGITRHGFFHTAIEDDSRQTVIVTSQAYPVFYLITNFSFFFVSGVILMVLWLIVYGLAASLTGFSFTYATRIQLYIYLSFSLPLLIAAITTLNRVSRSAEDQLNQDFQSRARHLSESVNSFLSSFLINEISRIDFENMLMERAKIVNHDVTIYDRTGKYIASSQPLILESHLISGLLDGWVLNRIRDNSETSIIRSEQIGKLLFNNCYHALRSSGSGELLGILSVPFFDSAHSLEATRISVLSNFLSIFTLIFILFSLLSFYIVNGLTFPLQYITRALSKTTLSGNNKPLVWKSEDEIGMMVSEYNRMLSNLEESKVELARTQKESAWREIAKQIAHEIKNPLTPMKLTLQQMEHQIAAGKLDEARTKEAINTLLAQVEILNEIATSFSTFARMPAPVLRPVYIDELLQQCANLFTGNKQGEIEWVGKEKFCIQGDEQLLTRIFSNILLNAFQSGRPGQPVQVKIGFRPEGKWIIIFVSDNGKGIPPEMTDRVFMPHFTTKESGSGLGLAIVRQGVEQSGGEIWFESTPNEGTTFYVKLPRAD
jgi:two-component system nitrogen regulation sensor histidine kinase NtrY